MKTVEQLQAQIDALHLAIRMEALQQIRAIMDRHGLTVDDLVTKSQGKRLKVQVPELGKLPKLNGKTPGTGQKRGPQPAKYRNPKTGETWSGLARPPAWIKDVKNRAKFLIEKP
jgi:DNA-binding protein H-NS